MRIRRIEIGDDVLSRFLVEVMCTLKRFRAVGLLHLDQKGVTTAQHVSNDSPGPQARRRVTLVEAQLSVASPDVEDAYFSRHRFPIP